MKNDLMLFCVSLGGTIFTVQSHFDFRQNGRNHLKMVEYAQFKFDHLFCSNFIQFGRNSIHGWFVCTDSGEILPVLNHFDQI
jgi:hypothetical protein